MCVEIEPTKSVKQYADDEDQCCAREARKKCCRRRGKGGSDETNSDTVQWAEHKYENTPCHE